MPGDTQFLRYRLEIRSEMGPNPDGDHRICRWQLDSIHERSTGRRSETHWRDA